VGGSDQKTLPTRVNFRGGVGKGRSTEKKVKLIGRKNSLGLEGINNGDRDPKDDAVI